MKMSTRQKFYNMRTAIVFSVAVFLLLAILVCPDGIALADTSNTEVDWRALYEDYIGDSNKDWYFDKEYLDLYGAMEAVHDMVNDPKFNKDALKADPIVIASIDNGIGAGYAYNDAYGTEVRVGFTHVVVDQKDAVFKVHPIFDGVILTDENGDYVYGNVAQEIQFTDKNGNMSLIVFANNGDIGHDLVSFDKHGVSTAGLIAFFIHMFGLEDYIKIMPINADDVYYFDSNGVFRQAYTFDAMDRAAIFAREHGADIINASFGGGRPTICDELASEILVVAAAGNDNKYYLQYPAGSDNVVGVVSYSRDADGEIELYTHSSDGSNYGEWYDIAAPGQNAVASAYGSYLSSPYTYSVMGGTSMASPFVAFAGALAMFRFRGYDNYGVGIELTPQVYKEMIVSGTDKTVTKVATEGTYTYPVLDLKGIVTADFYRDKEFLAKIGISVSEILEIATDAKAEHNVGDIITLSATTDPVGLFAKDKVYWWYVVDGATYDLGYGKEIHFQIPDLEGEYEIYCALEDEEGMPHIQNAVPLVFEVSRKAPESIEIGANIESEYKIDTSAVVELNATIYPANAYTEDTIVWWYELGGEEYTIGTGMTVEFAIPNEVGEYTLLCALQDGEGNRTLSSSNSIEFAVTYYELESVSIVGDVEREYKVDNTANITLNAVLNPTNAHVEDTLVWLLTTGENTTEIGEGFILGYNIPNVVGEYEIYCAFKNAEGYHTYSTNSFEFAVTYYELESMSIVGDVEREYKVDNTANITLNAVLNPTNAHVEDTLVWLLTTGKNTTEIGTGMTVEFSIPNEVGEYTIYCALQDSEGNRILTSSNSKEFAVSHYDPESIEISANIESEYKIDTSAVVELNATIYPANAYTEDTIVWWYELGGEEYSIGTGMTVEFAIPNEVGEYTIYCALQDSEGNRILTSSNSKEFAVSHYDPESIEISANIESEYKIDTSAVVELNATIYPANAYTEDTIVWWYELGGEEYSIGTGMTVEFAIPNEVGEYTIYCALQDSEGNRILTSSNSKEFAVSHYDPESIEISANIESEYKIDTSAVVELNATIYPANAYTDDTIVWWYELGGEEYSIGTGMTVEFAIPNKAGEYTIRCALQDSEGNVSVNCTNNLVFAVAYYAVHEIEIEEDNELENVVSFSIPAHLLSPDVVETIEWYLNDTLVSKEAQYACAYIFEGEYVITLKIDGQIFEMASFKVESNEPNTPPTDGGEDDPVVPPADDEPVTPPVDGGEDDPVVPPTDDEPVTPPTDGGEDDPVVPPTDDEPVTPPADGGEDEPDTPSADNNQDSSSEAEEQNNEKLVVALIISVSILAVAVISLAVGLIVIFAKKKRLDSGK